MKLSWVAILVAATALSASSTDQIAGRWNVKPAGKAPQTVGSIFLDLYVDGAAVTGLVTIGAWPGEAPIADGTVVGNHISFNATGYLDSTTGIPTCHFEATIDGDQMDVKMTVTHNAGGPLGEHTVYNFRGVKDPR